MGRLLHDIQVDRCWYLMTNDAHRSPTRAADASLTKLFLLTRYFQLLLRLTELRAPRYTRHIFKAAVLCAQLHDDVSLHFVNVTSSRFIWFICFFAHASLRAYTGCWKLLIISASSHLIAFFASASIRRCSTFSSHVYASWGRAVVDAPFEISWYADTTL